MAGWGSRSSDDGGSCSVHAKDLDVFHATFSSPDLTVFCRLDELGLEVIGQRIEADRAWLECRIVDPDDFCRGCGVQALVRDTVTRRLAHAPFGHRPTTLLVRVRRYRCATRPARRGCWTWSKAARNRCSRPGLTRNRTRSATGFRWSRWTGSPASRPPPTTCPTGHPRTPWSYRGSALRCPPRPPHRPVHAH